MINNINNIIIELSKYQIIGKQYDRKECSYQ